MTNKHKTRLAVIDLGTNTFHLLIVDPEGDEFKVVHRDRRFIKLAEEGIATIGDNAYQRGLNAMQAFAEELQEYQVNSVKAFGTAALRTASNGMDFRDEVKRKTGIQIELIDGSREAGLIHKGVQLAMPPSDNYRLIMDIGGGSVEFIIANTKGVAWAQSFPIGVAVLFKGFHHSDPIAESEKEALFSHLEQTLVPLASALTTHPCEDLVGASGTFDVLENMLAIKKPGPHCAQIDLTGMREVFQTVINSTLQDRLQMEKMPSERADMIVVAMLLIKYVIKLADIQNIFVSNYAMKEGMLAEMLS